MDDGSTDSSSRRASEFIEAHNMAARIVSQENGGPSSARNTGIKLSSGSFVAFLDADDLWLPVKLEKQVDFMLRNSTVDLSLTNYVIFNSSLRAKLKAVKAVDPLKQIHSWLNMRGFGGLVESTGMIRRASLSEDLLFDQSMKTTEGLDFTVNWYLKRKIAILPEFLTLYRISNNQLHTNVELIKKNVSRVSRRYPFLVNNEEALASYHQAYFELSGLRALGFFKKISLVFIHLVKMDFIFFSMLFSIITRNLRARVIPYSLRGKLLDNIDRRAL